VGQPAQHGQRGQAAVETAIVLPLMLFMLLGILQMSLAYHARLLNEYAAFKVARSASVSRVHCNSMLRAGLIALLPAIGSGAAASASEAGMRNRFVSAARSLIGENRPPNRVAGIPQIRVDWRLSGNSGRPFDHQLGRDDEPRKVHIRLAFFYEYRVPFANWIISRVWLSSQTGQAWATGADPITPVRRTAGRVTRASETSMDAGTVQQAIQNNYFTVPVVSTWSMRLMSDPLTTAQSGFCE
jgi:hypothetical protein